MTSAVKKIDLGLQGGGAHGAFTWGVLDRLLSEERISIEGISGTSAGAMNAVVVADAVKARIAEMQKYMPEGVNLNIRFDTTKFIRDSIGDMNFVMILSIILTALVCWLFLGSFISAFNDSLLVSM